MYPFLLDWTVNGHHLRLPSYGLLLAISFSLAYFLGLRRALILKEDPKHVENIFLVVVFSAILGSRLFHVVFEEWDYYAANPIKVFAVWEGGYTFYGAVITATLGIYLYCLIHKISFLQFIDLSTPSAALGLSLGRVGCFLAGCCWGRPTKMPWGVTFSNPDSFTSVHNVALHPTQLYESFGALLLFFFLEWRFKNRKYVGQIFFEGISIYAVVRFIVELFRGDDYRGYVFGGMISYSQLVSLAILPLSLAGMVIYSKAGKKKPKGKRA